MKQKVFDYIEELERKAKESEKYFKLWHEEKVKNNKAIEYAEDEIESAKGCIYRELPEEIYIEYWKEILDILRGEYNE